MTQRVAMISGASRGIGASIAQHLAEHGWAVSLGMRDPRATPIEPSASVLVCRFDALDPDSEGAWVDETIARFGRLDGLVHNAGIGARRSVIEATGEEFDALFAVNVKSPMRLSQHAWPHLIRSTGRIVVLASLSGKRVKSAAGGLYAMSKFAAVGLAHALRQAGKEAGVRATAICPAYVATDMAAGQTTVDPALLTQPEDIARIVHLVLELPPTASLPEIAINWTVEDCY
jgi:Short-chain alcohol dehydrogenase of unknown specificity